MKVPVMFAAVACGMLCAIVAGCEKDEIQESEGPEPYASRYTPLPSEAVLLSGATVLTGTGERLDDADVLMRDGKIVQVGMNLDAGGAERFDATGLWITPGIIDVHSHLGVYPSPAVDANDE